MQAVLWETANGDVHPLGDVSLIGRGAGVTVRLADQSISRHHATIRHEDGVYRVLDVGSANGTYVNGAALTSSRILREGDRLKIGALEFVFQLGRTLVPGGATAVERTQIAQHAPAPARDVPVVLMVADLKGFTELSSRLDAGAVADLLREWYADCTRILNANGATIDKFIGDCFFAYWHGADAAACKSALTVVRDIRKLEMEPATPARVELREKFGVSLDCRFGLHAGNVALGAMGNGINTALGDAVNTAFRIEALTRQFDNVALASRAFLEKCPEGLRSGASCGAHLLRGQSTPTEIFAPVLSD